MKKLLTRAASYLPPDRVAFIQKAYEYAAIAHEGQKRLSGEPFIRHPLETALYLVDLNMDATTLAAALPRTPKRMPLPRAKEAMSQTTRK